MRSLISLEARKLVKTNETLCNVLKLDIWLIQKYTHKVFKAYLKETLKVVAVLRHYDIKSFLTFITQKMLKINILNPFFMF